jgi:hypothetical protein
VAEGYQWTPALMQSLSNKQSEGPAHEKKTLDFGFYSEYLFSRFIMIDDNRAMIFNLFHSCTPRYNFSSTLYPSKLLVHN